MIRLEQVLARQHLTASTSRVRPRFKEIGSVCVRGPLLDHDREAGLCQVQAVLEAAYGYRAVEGGRLRRHAPSAGGLYPTEVLCVAWCSSGWTVLGYDFRVGRFREFPADADALAAQCGLVPGRAALVLTSTLWRTVQRYGYRGYRYCLLDAGVVMGNLAAVASATEFEISALPQYLSDRIGTMLELPECEIVVGAVVFDCLAGSGGLAVRSPGTREPRIPLESAPRMAAELERSIRLDRTLRSPGSPSGAVTLISRFPCAAGETIELLWARRSARGFRRGFVDPDRFAALRENVATLISAWPGAPGLRLGYLVRDQRLLPAGLEDRSMTRLLDADSEAITRLFGNQPLLADSDLFLIVGLPRAGGSERPANFRPELLHCGVLASGVGLIATATGSAHTIVGGFDDPALASLFDQSMLPVMAIAFGGPSARDTKNDTGPERE
ncbi:hypothetical protein [Nocardia niigatensis]|uniref:hypothetical protein n=1 Tax=Nocardia niigatensis TaxID=209249 RepID=UPI0002E76BF7|nr:hypothetical protein [Nocardia niigatensis]